jgi:hypothetical protein
MRNFLPNHRTVAVEPEAPPSVARRAVIWLIVAVVTIVLCVLVVLFWSHFVLRPAQEPPGEMAVLPLPEGVELLSQAASCGDTGTSGRVCSREFIVEEPGTDPTELAAALADHYEDKRDYDLTPTSDGLYSSLCEGGKTCLLIGPISTETVMEPHPSLPEVPPDAVVVRAIRRDKPG